jgi:Na+-driven multidrug efflux pump
MPLLDDQYTGAVRWPRLRQDVAIVTWPSFLVASVATMICFAFIDPVLVGNDDYPPPAFATRMSGYAIGFFFFWLISALSSLLTLYLARTARPEPPARQQDPDEGTRSVQ